MKSVRLKGDLFVIPITDVAFDRLGVKTTGKSSAHGLIEADEIEREVAVADHTTAKELVGSGK